MENHPIEGLMLTAMSSIENMIDVNTIIGEPIETSSGVVIIPISKVTFGFAAGGSEFKGETIDEYTKKDKDETVQYRLPFGGGSGAAVSINPVAFLIVEEGKVKLLPVTHSSCIDKILDYVPDLFERMADSLNKLTKDSFSNINKEKDKKIKINKVPKTTQKDFGYKMKNKNDKEEEEMTEEFEDLFEENNEFEDD